MKKTILFLALLLTTSLLFGQKKGHTQCAVHKSNLYKKAVHSEKSLSVNQEHYDVTYYGLDLKFDPSVDVISGTVVVSATVIEEAISTVELNLSENMVVSSVAIEEDALLVFTHENDILTVNLGSALAPGNTFSITISYSGTPDAGDHIEFDFYQGENMIWSLSEAYGAREWWPCKDFPSDKAETADMKFTVPSSMIAASNGILQETTVDGDFTTYWWHESYPITSYLISIAAYPYATFSHSYEYGGATPMPVDYYVFPNHLEELQEDYQVIVPMLETFSDLFGQYPFVNEKYGHAEYRGGGGMEHQTLTSLSSSSEDLLSHELAHQWWGDLVTNESFHHIWLNEGFATYSEALWAEREYGVEEYFDYMDDTEYFGSGTIYVEDPETQNIFDGGLSYSKGSWILHMLRHVVGDETFFELLPQWAASVHAYGTGTTEDFRDFCEEISGMELDYFFEQWIYGESYPIYDVIWTTTTSGDEHILDFTINQNQSWQIFKMPVDITVTTASGEETFVVWDTIQTQDFQLTLSEEPLNVKLDKNNWILKKTGAAPEDILANHIAGNCVLTVSAIGSIGFDDAGEEGSGFIYPYNGENLLYFGSFMAGNSESYVADSPSEEDKDWEVTNNPLGYIVTGETQISDQDTRGIYADTGHPTPKGIRVTQNSYSWADYPNEDYVIIEYDIENTSSEAVSDIYAAVLLDFDIEDFEDDNVATSPDDKMVYMWGSPHAGLKILGNTPVANLTAINNPTYSYDGFSESNKYKFLNGTLNFSESSQADDWSCLASSGPFTIASGSSQKVAFAILGGETLEDLLTNSSAAESNYNTLTDIDDISSAPLQSFQVSPNPTSGKVSISLSTVMDASIILSDVLGKEIWRKEINTQSLNADFSQFANGVYNISVQTRQGSVSQKLVLQH